MLAHFLVTQQQQQEEESRIPGVWISLLHSSTHISSKQIHLYFFAFYFFVFEFIFICILLYLYFVVFLHLCICISLPCLSTDTSGGQIHKYFPATALLNSPKPFRPVNSSIRNKNFINYTLLVTTAPNHQHESVYFVLFSGEKPATASLPLAIFQPRVRVYRCRWSRKLLDYEFVPKIFRQYGGSCSRSEVIRQVKR